MFPVAEEKFKIEVAAESASVGLAMVAVPVVAPRLSAVAAPPMLRVVAVVLKASNDAESVMTEVLNVGEVAKTKFPVPVVPVTEARRFAAVMVETRFFDASVATRREAVRPVMFTLPVMVFVAPSVMRVVSAESTISFPTILSLSFTVSVSADMS